MNTCDPNNQIKQPSGDQNLPAPLVGAEVDLRGLPFMPLETDDLLDGPFFALSSGDEFKAGMALRCRSWSQRPAASLPSDDGMLAYLSGAGSRWGAVKAIALRDWILCSDGRLYHPVIAERAWKAWEGRLRQRKRAEQRWKGSDSRGRSKSPNAAAFPAADATAYPMAVQVQIKEKVKNNNHKSAGGGRLIFPEQLPPDQKAEIERLLRKYRCNGDHSQSLLDELEGAMIGGKIRNPIGYARKLAESFANGSFIKEKAFKAVEARHHRARQAAQEQKERDDREKAEQRRRERGQPTGYKAFCQMREERRERHGLLNDSNFVGKEGGR